MKEIYFSFLIWNFSQLSANNLWKLANATDNSSAGIMTKSETVVNDSHMADAKATRTILPPKKLVNTNARHQELAKVSYACF